MNTEKRILIASVLSVAVMVGYATVVQRVSPKKPQNVALAHSAVGHSSLLDQATQSSTDQPLDDEPLLLDGKELTLEVGKRSATVWSVKLKSFKKLQSMDQLTFGDRYPVTQFRLPYATSEWSLMESTAQMARWEQREGNVVRSLTIDLDPTLPIYRLTFSVNGGEGPVPVQIQCAWGAERGTTRSNIVEAVLKTSHKYARYKQGTARTVSRDVSVVTLTEQFFCQSVQLGELGRASTVNLSRSADVPMMASVEFTAQQAVPHTIPIYVGPRDYFWMERSDFKDAFPVGLLSKIGLALMLFLKWMASVTHSYGAAIIGLSVFVTLMLSPFTLISFRSMKKMQELQPKLDAIRKKYEDDPKRVNQEIFGLFKEHRVSPLSGCLPMLLQMPVFFALWSAMSHVVELRGQSFLWIDDLTMPDRLFHLPFGFELNLLPILMAGAMYIQTKLSQGKMKTQPGAASNPMSGPMMPVLFGLMFYNVQSALVLYWLCNSVASILIYRAAKL